MIVVDSSALVAIMLGEPEAEAFAHCILGSSSRTVSAVNVLETLIVVGARQPDLLPSLRAVLEALDLEVAPFDATAAQAAHDAYRRWGKGSGTGAKLNMGDCAAYALAMSLGAPLLYKGDDFARTDVRSAVG